MFGLTAIHKIYKISIRVMGNQKGVRKKAMVKNITIYTSNNCAYCGMVKQYLQIKGQNYDEINIEEQPDRQPEMIDMTGQSRVPVTVVTRVDGSRDVTVGYNVSKLASAIN